MITYNIILDNGHNYDYNYNNIKIIREGEDYEILQGMWSKTE